MSKSLIVILIIAILALAGYAVYSAYPLIAPKLNALTNQAAVVPSPTISATPAVTASPSAVISPNPTPIAIPKSQLENNLTINDYLKSKVAIKGFDGNVYCAYEILAETGAHPDTLYLLALCQEYYEKQQTKYPGTGVIVPIALQLKWVGDSFTIVKHQTPKLGSDYAADVRSIFPSAIAQNILNDKYSLQTKNLQQKVDSAVY